MDQLSMVEELAWLVKDNLPCKHLILSAEETFIEFLEHSLSSEEILEFEPMVSYHRMLLHRLADIFGLAHESIGEGEERHLVLERCQDSSIPPVLVSDILEWQYGETQNPQATCQLLKREVTSPDLQQKQILNQIPSISFEEREAAYLAARERIFSLSASQECNEPKERVAPRPRTVPVVARRMIAHALGKRIMVDSLSQKPEAAKTTEIPCADDKLTDKNLNDASQISNVAQQAAKASAGHTPAAAAKRMINKYLNTDASCLDDKMREKKLDTKVLCIDEKMTNNNINDSSQDTVVAQQAGKASLGNSPAAAAKRMSGKSLNAEIPCIDEKITDKALNTRIPCIDEKKTDKNMNDVPQVAGAALQAGKASLAHTPATAAKRMFAQALGLPLVNGSFKGFVELSARPDNGTNCAADQENFPVSTSLVQKALCVANSVEVLQERSSSLTSDWRPEGVHDSRDQIEEPSVSSELQIHPQNHTSLSRMSNVHVPGKIAQRLLAQALGIHNVSSISVEGSRTKNSSGTLCISPTSKSLRADHITGLPGSGGSTVSCNVLDSSSDLTTSVNDDREECCIKSDGHFPLAGHASGNSYWEVAVPIDSDTSRSIDPERHAAGASPQKFTEERISPRSISFKGRNGPQANTKRTTSKTSGKPRCVHTSGPSKKENCSCRHTRACPADESSVIYL